MDKAKQYRIEESLSGFRVGVYGADGAFLHWLDGPKFLRTKEEAETLIRTSQPAEAMDAESNLDNHNHH